MTRRTKKTPTPQLDLTPVGQYDDEPQTNGSRQTNGAAPWTVGMNEEQSAIIAHQDGPIYCGAVAGCGKTRALVNRIARLVHDGQDPTRILAVTFSKKAATEMNDRLSRDLDITSARVGTWHSLALQVIKDDQLPCSQWRVDGDSGPERFPQFVKDAMGYRYLDWKQGDATKVKSFIGVCKANLWQHDSDECADEARKRFGFDASKAIQAFRIADELTHGNGILTFDDMLVFAARHLQNPDNAERWGARWDHVMVDEAQDNSIVQIVMARQLARGHRNIMAVGDIAQAIYSFRGSTPQHLVDFAGEWQATSVFMNRNYRSGRAIIAAANLAISSAATRLPVEMVAMRDHEGSATAVGCADLDDEGRSFTAWVQQHVAGGGHYSDCTALFRTNAQSRALEESLLSARIPYVVVGGTSFYERREVKGLLAYLRVAADRDPTGTAMKACINSPFRFLGKAFVDRVGEQADMTPDGPSRWTGIVREVAQQGGVQRRQVESAQEWARMIEEIQETMKHPRAPGEDGPARLLQYVVQRTQYIEWLTKEEGEENVENSRASNVRELCRVAEKFPTVRELLDYIDETIKAAARQRKQAQGDRVLLMSIHRSKGLEWPCVWLVGCVFRVLPHAFGNLEEERRLFYVACTRARDTLVCSYPRSMAMKAGIRDMEPSQFLFDAGLLTRGDA